MRLNRTWIESNIPHQGRMCLLDEVIEWDARRILCRGTSHRLPDNPLRSQGRLGIASGIEYAAQAMAVHGALLVGGATMHSRAEAGFLAGVRNVRLHAHRLDDIAADLICEAILVAGDSRTALYEFAVTAAAQPLLGGRATVVFDANEKLKP